MCVLQMSNRVDAIVFSQLKHVPNMFQFSIWHPKSQEFRKVKLGVPTVSTEISSLFSWRVKSSVRCVCIVLRIFIFIFSHRLKCEFCYAKGCSQWKSGHHARYLTLLNAHRTDFNIKASIYLPPTPCQHERI